MGIRALVNRHLHRSIMKTPAPLSGQNPLVPWLNALLACVKRCELKAGTGYKVRESGDGVTLEINIPRPAQSIPLKGAGLPSSSTLSPGSYSSAPTPSIYIDTTNNVWYYCVTSGSESTSAWLAIGEKPVIYFAITSLSNADYFTAVPLSITYPSGTMTVSFGSAVSVAKNNRQRTSVASELIDGVTISYSSYTNDNTRTASDGTNTEFQVCFPRYTTVTELGLSIASSLTGSSALAFLRSQCVVKCSPIITGITDGASSQIVFEELHQRVWARRYVQ